MKNIMFNILIFMDIYIIAERNNKNIKIHRSVYFKFFYYFQKRHLYNIKWINVYPYVT